MNTILESFDLPYVMASNLLPLLRDYANPHDFISRLVKKGELIRLKNGFFLIAEHVKSSGVPHPQIGNLLHGPSYVSLEWALSFYGMIPEGVVMVTSVTPRSSRSYDTPVGTFEYTHLSHSRYAVGITQKESNGMKFLIATPEKALADLVHFKSRDLSRKDLLIDLVEARRIEEQELRNLDKHLLEQIAERYRSAAVHQLINVIGLL